MKMCSEEKFNIVKRLIETYGEHIVFEALIQAIPEQELHFIVERLSIKDYYKPLNVPVEEYYHEYIY